jgi:hypothetical protein
LTTSNRTNEAATAVQNAAARIRFALETPRLIGRHFCLFLAEVGSLIRVMGCALLRRFAYRAGGCHQTREGNADRSTHRHCVASFSLGIPLPRANE